MESNGGGFASSSSSQLLFGLPFEHFDETDKVTVEVHFSIWYNCGTG